MYSLFFQCPFDTESVLQFECCLTDYSEQKGMLALEECNVARGNMLL